MSTITTRDGTEIYYKDWGEGPVITFSHGWPLNADAWESQLMSTIVRLHPACLTATSATSAAVRCSTPRSSDGWLRCFEIRRDPTTSGIRNR